MRQSPSLATTGRRLSHSGVCFAARIGGTVVNSRGPSLILLLAGFLLAACAPAVAPSTGSVAQSPSAVPVAPTSLTIAIAVEPRVLMMGLGLEGAVPNTAGDVLGALHRKLASYDDQGAIHPQLAL